MATADKSFEQELLHLSESSIDKLEAWPGRDTKLEAGLELWVLKIQDRQTQLRIALAACQKALPTAIAAFEASDCDFGDPRHGESWGCDISAIEQLERVSAWIEDEATPLNSDIVDNTRQLNVWDNDLKPTLSRDYYLYFIEATNLLAMAALQHHNENDEPCGTWSTKLACARATVCAFKSSLSCSSSTDEESLAISSFFECILRIYDNVLTC
mmetsp:Transcript_19296/g.29285  ORF Transcript_19296/g.29285 Transcript_19296/m.29285 type:complete len:213 (-) Transcript_19296:56-694(-)